MDSWVGKIPYRQDRLLTPVYLGFPGGSDGKESTCNLGDLGSIPGLGRSPGGRACNPLQYSCLENPMDRGAWRAIVQPMGSQRVRHDLVTKAQQVSMCIISNISTLCLHSWHKLQKLGIFEICYSLQAPFYRT